MQKMADSKLRAFFLEGSDSNIAKLGSTKQIWRTRLAFQEQVRLTKMDADICG